MAAQEVEDRGPQLGLGQRGRAWGCRQSDWGRAEAVGDRSSDVVTGLGVVEALVEVGVVVLVEALQHPGATGIPIDRAYAARVVSP
jgi:hypothetical protein